MRTFGFLKIIEVLLRFYLRIIKKSNNAEKYTRECFKNHSNPTLQKLP